MFSCTVSRLSLPVAAATAAISRGGWRTQFLAGVSSNKHRLMVDFQAYLDSDHRSHSNLMHCINACAESLKRELPQARVRLAEEMIAKSKVVPTVQIYNSLLHVYLRNRHQFSPSGFLKTMKENGVAPNRGTLFLLLNAYCQRGNVEGAKEILQEIQANEMPANEDLYALLIMGNAINNDLGAAEELIEVMKANGLVPKQTAYSALLCGYAYQGDLDSVKRVLELMEANNIYPGHKVYVDILEALSLGGQSDKMKELLGMVQNPQWIYSDMIDKVHLFAGRGDFASSAILLEQLAKIMTLKKDTFYLSKLHVIIFKLLMRSNVEAFDKFLPNFHLFESSGISLTRCYEMAIRFIADNTKNWENLKLILDQMKTNGHRLKSLYLYPTMAFMANKQDTKGLLEWLVLSSKEYSFHLDRTMILMSMNAYNQDIASLFSDFVEKGLLDDPESLCCIFEFVCSQDLYSGVSGMQLFCQYLKDHPKSEMLPVFRLMRAFSKKLSLAQEQNVDLCKLVIPTMAQLCMTDEEMACLQNTIHFTCKKIARSNPPEDIFSFLDAIKDYRIKNQTYRIIMLILQERGYTKEHDEIAKLMGDQVSASDADWTRYIVLLKKARSLGKPKDAVASFNAMKSQKYPIHSHVINDLVITLLKADRLDDALQYYYIWRNNKRMPYPREACIELTRTFLLKGDFLSAVDIRMEFESRDLKLPVLILNLFIEAYGKKGHIEKSREEFQLVKTLYKPTTRTYLSLMEGYCYHGDMAGAKAVFDEAIRETVINNKNLASLISKVIEAAMKGNDIKGAVAFFEESLVLYEGIRFDITPFVQLVNQCEVARKRDLTKRILACLMSRKVSSELLDCMFLIALVRAGQFSEAVEFFEDRKGKTLSVQGIADFTEFLAKDDPMCSRDIESVIKLLEESSTDSGLLYTPLVQAYATEGKFDDIRKVKDQLESSSKTLDDSFHDLVKKLTEHGLEPEAMKQQDRQDETEMSLN